MRLPIIKHLSQFVEDNDVDFLLETIETLEHLTLSDSIKEDEMDVLGELISNLYGAVEVSKSIQDGIPKQEALNSFMQRVMGSIDK